MDVVNLEKLAGYLEAGDLQANFDMSTYCDLGYLYQGTCGSVGCAVGHGPYAGIPKDPHETWIEYANRVFGLNIIEQEWCFGSYWAKYDPTSLGAARRIRFLIRHQDIVNDPNLSQKELIKICNETQLY